MQDSSLSSFMRCLMGLGALVLAGCDREIPYQSPIEDDPAILAALAAPLMIDSDLTSQDQAVMAVSAPPPIEGLPGALPSDAARNAREAALMAAGPMPSFPPLVSAKSPTKHTVEPEYSEMLRSALWGDASLLGVLKNLSPECREGARYTGSWAASMPGNFPIFPHGTVREAWGSDVQGCAFRSVAFQSVASPEEVLGFYEARAVASRFKTTYSVQNGVHKLQYGQGLDRLVVEAFQDREGRSFANILVSGRILQE